MNAYNEMKRLFQDGASCADAAQSMRESGDYDTADVDAAQERLTDDILARRV